MKKDDIKTLIVVIIVCAVCLALVFILSRKKKYRHTKASRRI